MRFLVFNLILTCLWVSVTASLTAPNILLGFCAGAVSLAVMRHHIPEVLHRVHPFFLLLLVGLFVKELALSAVNVAILVVKPNMRLQPGMFAYPLALTRDFEITLLANLITLTPGTLSVDISDDRRTLTVHALDAHDPAAVKRAIALGFERRIAQAFPISALPVSTASR